MKNSFCKMSKDPAFLFYSDNFLSGVSDLTMKERGQYITLLCLQHLKGHITEKMIEISVPGVSEDVMKKFSRDENGNFFNSRLRDEADKRRKHTEKQRDRAIKGWEKRKQQKEAAANAVALPLENGNENEIENKDDNENESNKRARKKFTYEDVVNPWSEIDGFDELWQLWTDYRKEKRLTPYKPIGLQGAYKQLWEFSGGDLNTATQILHHSISNNYQGFFKLKNGQTTKTGGITPDKLKDFLARQNINQEHS